MSNQGIYGQRKWQDFSGQIAGTADTLSQIGASGDDDTIAVYAIPTFHESVTFNIGSGEAITMTVTDVSAPFVFTNTVTTAATTGGRALFQLNISGAMGGWANALKAYTVITTTTGSASGLGSAFCAEMLLPASTLSTGSYGVLELELVTQASGTVTSPVAFQWMQVSGNSTATANWEDSGYLFIIKGLTDDTGNIFDSNTGPTVKASLRILIGTTPYYIMLANSPTS